MDDKKVNSLLTKLISKERTILVDYHQEKGIIVIKKRSLKGGIKTIKLSLSKIKNY